MLALEIIVAAAVLVAVAFLASRDTRGLEDEPTDQPDIGLPEGRPIRSQDIAELRLRTVSAFWGGLRGYRYGDVDAVLVRVEEALRAHEIERRARPALGRTESGRSADPDAG